MLVSEYFGLDDKFSEVNALDGNEVKASRFLLKDDLK